MPRSVNPASISVGKGRIPQGTVEDSSLKNPNRDTAPLKAHIDDPLRAHMAVTTGIVDVGGFYTSDEVEGALQEIGGGFSSGTQNGVISGCTFTFLGLTVTLSASSLVRIGTQHDLSGQSELLNDGVVNWLYVDTTGTLTHTTGASPPSFSTPENVLLWRIVTAAGTVTSSTDMRWFIINIDRKPSLTVRSAGTDTDKHSEASFESLDAVMLYLAHFGAGVIRTHTVNIKGPLTVSSTLTVPVNNVIFQGEDGATLTTGAALAPMFDISGMSRIQFRDITFNCDHLGSTAIGAPSGAVIECVIERCKVTTGAGAWDVGVDWTFTNTQRSIIRDCNFTASSSGIMIEFPIDVRVLDTIVLDSTFGSGGYGIRLGPTAGPVGVSANSQIRGCRTTFFALGISAAADNIIVDGCFVNEATTGVYMRGQRASLLATTITLSSFSGLVGVTLASAGTDNGNIRGCRIENTRGGWAGIATTYGIGFDGNTDWNVTDTQIVGFLNTFDNSGYGIFFAGAASNRTQMKGLFIDNCQYGINSTVLTATYQKVLSCHFRRVTVGIYTEAAASEINDTVVEMSSSRGLIGLWLAANNIRVRGVQLQNGRAFGSYAILQPAGIFIDGSRDRISIEDAFISGFLSTTSPSFGIVAPTAGCTGLTIQGGKIETSYNGISLTLSEFARIIGVDLSDTSSAITVTGDHTVIDGCSGFLDSTTGIVGISASGASTRIANCTFTVSRAFTGVENPIGIALSAADSSAINCQLDGFLNTTGADIGTGILVGAAATNTQVIGCRVNTTKYGIWMNTGCTGVVSGCSITEVEIGVKQDSSKVDVVDCNITLSNTRGVSGIGSVVAVQNCEYNGNRIDCDSVAGSVGIEFLNTSASYTTRVKVQGNTVVSSRSTGILVRGRCLDMVVSGNVVDGYLSADPYNPTAYGIRLLADVDAPDAIEISGNNVQRCVMGISAEGSFGLPLDNISINGNTVHHCAYGQAGASITTYVTAGSKGIGALHVRRLQANDNNVYRIGISIDDANVEAFPTGAFVLSHGIFAMNCRGASAVGNTVTDSMASGGGATNTGIFFLQSSAAHGAGNTFFSRTAVINSNNVFWNTGLVGEGQGLYGILFQVDRGTDVAAFHETRDVSIVGNSVWNTLSGGGCISFLVGTASNVHGVVIEGNTLGSRSVEGAGNGIDIQTSGTANPILHDLIIRSNTISDLDNGQSGIQALAGGTGGQLRRVSIDGNTISRISFAGIFVQAQNTSVAVSEVSITGNKLNNTDLSGGAPAINVTCSGSSVTEFTQFSICDNVVIDVPGLDYGIYFSSTGQSVFDLEVSGNTVNNSTGSGLTQTGVYIHTLASGATNANVVGLKISDNMVTCDNSDCLKVEIDGSLYGLNVSNNTLNTIELGSPLVIETNRTNAPTGDLGWVQDVVIDGNICGDGTATGTASWNAGSRLKLYAVTTGNKLRNVVVSNNVFSNSTSAGLFQLKVQETNSNAAVYSVENVVVSGNVFRNSDTAGLTLSFGAIATGELDTGVSGIDVNGNTFSQCATGSSDVLNYTSDALARNISVTNNTFVGNQAGDNADVACIHLSLGDESGGECNGVLISGNSLYDNGGAGILIDDSGTGTWIQNDISVTNNVIRDQVNVGIFVNLVNVISGDCAKNIKIEGNLVHGIPTVASGSDGGIVFKGPSAHSVHNLSVSGNQIKSVDGGVSGALYVRVDSQTSSAAETTQSPRNIRVDNNSVSEIAANKGISVDINLVGATGAQTRLFRNLSVCGNQVDKIAGGHGIEVAVALVTGATASSKIIVENIKVSNNQVWTVTGGVFHGVFLNLTASGTKAGRVHNVQLSGNEVFDPQGKGIYFHGPGNTTDVILLEGISINENIVRDADTSGILAYIQTPCESLHIVNNQIFDLGGGGGATDGGIAIDTTPAAQTDNLKDTLVMGNQVTDPGATSSYQFFLDVVVDTFGFHSNTSRGGSIGVTYDLGVNGTHKATSWMSNSFQNATTRATNALGTAGNLRAAGRVHTIVGNQSDDAGNGWTPFSANAVGGINAAAGDIAHNNDTIP